MLLHEGLDEHVPAVAGQGKHAGQCVAKGAVEFALLRLLGHVLEEVDPEALYRVILDVLGQPLCQHQEIQLDLVEVKQVAEIACL